MLPPPGLIVVRAGDHRASVVEQGLQQEFLGECGAVMFLTQILQRMRPKYQDRSYRYGLVEIGHIGQNVYLAATSMGLGACGIGAFMDDDINAMLGVDGVEEAAAVAMIGTGRTAFAIPSALDFTWATTTGWCGSSCGSCASMRRRIRERRVQRYGTIAAALAIA